jgi:hypothetical protein
MRRISAFASSVQVIRFFTFLLEIRFGYPEIAQEFLVRDGWHSGLTAPLVGVPGGLLTRGERLIVGRSVEQSLFHWIGKRAQKLPGSGHVAFLYAVQQNVQLFAIAAGFHTCFPL